MKAYLLTSGTIFALFAAFHFFVTYEHWRTPGSDLWHITLTALIGVLSAALAVWGLRLARRTTATDD
ncbi:MAG: hypothetical protein ACRELU_03435 [Gemmatimonadota bacterium]